MEPIYQKSELVGMLYNGDKEKDLVQLRSILNNLKIGKTGYVFVFDEQGKLLIHPGVQEGQIPDDLFHKIGGSSSGLINTDSQTSSLILLLLLSISGIQTLYMRRYR